MLLKSITFIYPTRAPVYRFHATVSPSFPLSDFTNKIRLHTCDMSIKMSNIKCISVTPMHHMGNLIYTTIYNNESIPPAN